MDELKRLLRGLGDFGFTRLITPQVVGLVFVLAIVVGGLGYIYGTVSWFQMNSKLGAAYLLIIGPLTLFLSVLWYRVTLEIAVLLFRINGMRREKMALERRAAGLE